MSEIRQRWRVIVRRGPEARDLTHRDVGDAWEAALESSGLPVARSEGERPRPKVTFAAPVPVGLTADREPLEISLTERRSIAVVRSALERVLPAGHGIVDLFDVWTGAAPIGGQVVAADYTLGVNGVTPVVLASAVRQLLASRELMHERTRGDRVRTQDLRPLIVDMAVVTDPGRGNAGESTAAEADRRAALTLLMRLRHDPERGVGRPDDVLAALEEVAGKRIGTSDVSRERVWLAEDLVGRGLPPLGPAPAGAGRR